MSNIIHKGLDHLRELIFSTIPRWETRVFGEYGILVERSGKPINGAVDVQTAATLHNLAPALLAMAEKMSVPLRSSGGSSDGSRDILTCRGCDRSWLLGEDEQHFSDCPVVALKHRFEGI